MRIGILGCANIARQFVRDVAGSPVATVVAVASRGFCFAAEAFAGVVMARDFAAIERAARASLDNAATLEALARSARPGHAVDVQV